MCDEWSAVCASVNEWTMNRRQASAAPHPRLLRCRSSPGDPGVPTYLVASYVAVSRLHDNRHYASDVVMGAATGIIIGRSVTWHGRNFYGSVIPGGVRVTITARNDQNSKSTEN